MSLFQEPVLIYIGSRIYFMDYNQARDPEIFLDLVEERLGPYYVEAYARGEFYVCVVYRPWTLTHQNWSLLVRPGTKIRLTAASARYAKKMEWRRKNRRGHGYYGAGVGPSSV